MTAEELTYYLTAPGDDHKEMRARLRKAAGEYPYCSLFHMALAAAEKQTAEKNREKLIRKAAAYAPDRAALYHFLPRVLGAAEQEESPGDPEPEGKGETPFPGDHGREALSQEDLPGSADPRDHERETRAPEQGPEATSTQEEQALVKKAAPGKIALNIDDNLPHTFTFWLRRIREVSGNVKLDTDQKITRTVTDGLEKQYYDSLASHKTFSEFEGKVSVEYDMSRKEDRIIAKFIQEDPQAIKPAVNLPSRDRSLPRESGAENDDKDLSAGDDGDFFSETLAKIYTEQGMTQKAIEVYKKLSLKFPEKSSYFAGLIKDLQEN